VFFYDSDRYNYWRGQGGKKLENRGCKLDMLSWAPGWNVLFSPLDSKMLLDRMKKVEI